jgi:hypothetical protein
MIDGALILKAEALASEGYWVISFVGETTVTLEAQMSDLENAHRHREADIERVSAIWSREYFWADKKRAIVLVRYRVMNKL